jgi:hypothetical protein
LGIGLGAQAPAGDPVSVSFLALGRDGRPITDLKSDEVQLRVDGRPRAIKSLQRIDAGGGGTASAPALPAPYGSNGTTEAGAISGRTIFLVINDTSFRPGNERLAKQSIEQFLGTLSPTDRVALITSPQPTIRVDPTTPAEVRTALARVAGVAAPNLSEDEAACRTRETLESLRALFTSLASARTSTTVMFFSSGLSATTRTTGKMGMTQCDLSTDHFQNVGAAAAAAGSHVYVIQGDLNVAQRSDGLENLAGVVGAQVLLLAAATDNPLSKIATETSTTYVASFDPEPSERNGQVHRIELKLARPEVTSRSPAQLPIATATARTAKKNVNPRDMLREATAYRDLPLRVAGFVSRDTGEKLKLVVVGEPIDSTTKLTAAVAGVYDAKGRLSQSTVPSEALGAMPMMVAMVVEPGPHRIRLAASDSAGRSGAADYEINASLATAGSFKMSALLLGTNQGGFKPMLEFKDEPAAFATFELYGKPPSTLPLKLELAATPDGPALQQVPPSGSGTKDPDRFIISGTFDLAALAPGDYAVRATVGSSETGGEGRVTRTLRKVK